MWVIIQEIPPDTTERELYRFLSRQLGYRGRLLGTPLGRKNRPKSCSLLQMTDWNGCVECCGLAELESDKPEDEMLRQLNGHWLRGNRITVRKYYHRSRTTQTGFTPGVKERRRSDLRIERCGMSRSALPGFHLVHRLRRSIS